jgi:hypothetical protein
MMIQGETFKTKLGVNEGEIIGSYPEGQTVPMTINSGAYQVMINGFKGIVSRQLFDVIFEPGKAPVVEAPVIIPVKKTHRKAVK